MTDLLYLKDFDVFSCLAVIVEMRESSDGRLDVELDRTCFYPRGGGQDWDTGIISADGHEFGVDEVRLDHHGIVHHLGDQFGGTFAPGQQVTCKVDVVRRTLNTKLHSAGHLIDVAVDRLGFSWTPRKRSALSAHELRRI